MPSTKDVMKLMAGFDQSRLNWEKIKKNAGNRGVNTAVFKGGLGPALDDFAKTYKAVLKARTPAGEPPKPGVQKLRAQEKKIAVIVTQYKKTCQDEAKKTNDAAVRTAWGTLFTVLGTLQENRDAAVGQLETWKPLVRASETKYVK